MSSPFSVSNSIASVSGDLAPQDAAWFRKIMSDCVLCPRACHADRLDGGVGYCGQTADIMFVDFTGCGEYRQNYDRKAEAANGDVWLWNSRNGCRRVTYQNEAFSSVSFRKSLGNLPSDSVAYVYPDEQGNIWIGTDCGVVQVTGDKTILVEKRNTFAAQSFGKDIFFLSTNAGSYGYD